MGGHLKEASGSPAHRQSAGGGVSLPQTGVRGLLFAVVCASGCALHSHGLVTSGGAMPEVMTPTGEEYRLVLGPETQPIGHLEGHLVELWGTRVFKTVRVRDFNVHEGLHGMQAWVGVLVAQGAQVGIDDRNSGAFYWIDEEAARTLATNVGDPVLLEGFVDGPHRVRVRYYRVLR